LRKINFDPNAHTEIKKRAQELYNPFGWGFAPVYNRKQDEPRNDLEIASGDVPSLPKKIEILRKNIRVALEKFKKLPRMNPPSIDQQYQKFKITNNINRIIDDLAREPNIPANPPPDPVALKLLADLGHPCEENLEHTLDPTINMKFLEELGIFEIMQSMNCKEEELIEILKEIEYLEDENILLNIIEDPINYIKNEIEKIHSRNSNNNITSPPNSPPRTIRPPPVIFLDHSS